MLFEELFLWLIILKDIFTSTLHRQKASGMHVIAYANLQRCSIEERNTI